MQYKLVQFNFPLLFFSLALSEGCDDETDALFFLTKRKEEFLRAVIEQYALIDIWHTLCNLANCVFDSRHLQKHLKLLIDLIQQLW